jgi:hypothetical protein
MSFRLPPVVVRHLGAPSWAPRSPQAPKPANQGPRETAAPRCPTGHTAVRTPTGWACVITGLAPRGGASRPGLYLQGVPQGLGMPNPYVDAITQAYTIADYATIPQPAGNAAAIQQAAAALASDVARFQPADRAAVSANADYQAIMAAGTGAALTDPQAATLNGHAAAVSSLLTTMLQAPFAYGQRQAGAVAIYLQNMINTGSTPVGPLGTLIDTLTTAIGNMPAAAKQSLLKSPDYIALTTADWGALTNNYTSPAPAGTLYGLLASAQALNAAIAALTPTVAPPPLPPVAAPAPPAAGITPMTAAIGGAGLIGATWLVAKFLL